MIDNPVTIGVASGKGGVGKTTVTVSMALMAAEPLLLLDCDVEAPNCALSLNPEIENVTDSCVPVPEIDTDRCIQCRACVEICAYNALSMPGGTPLLFPELCHGCGGCFRICPAGAIKEVDRKIGVVESGSTRHIRLVTGRLNPGEPFSPPVIRDVRRHAADAQCAVLIDAPPGSACPMVAALRGVDYALLAAEPTPFGLNDLIIAAETLAELKVPFGVVINRCDIGDDRVRDWCAEQQVPVLLEIPESREVAEACAKGVPACEVSEELAAQFRALYQRALQEAGKAAAHV
jgi:MinD superfamily P-loop ATPase